MTESKSAEINRKRVAGISDPAGQIGEDLPGTSLVPVRPLPAEEQGLGPGISL
jgi:hypothetical protein